jgi:uncharacterized coiled-coil protein SlyX
MISGAYKKDKKYKYYNFNMIEQFVELNEKTTYQQKQINQLNETVRTQNRMLARLEKKLDRLNDRLPAEGSVAQHEAASKKNHDNIASASRIYAAKSVVKNMSDSNVNTKKSVANKRKRQNTGEGDNNTQRLLLTVANAHKKQTLVKSETETRGLTM